MIILESSVNDLYNSAVAAFPHTTKRQHSIDTIKIVQLDWSAFLNLKTLFLRGRAINEGREYKSLILFKNVQYSTEEDADLSFTANNGKEYYIRKLSENDTQVILRCNCPDFHWRFNYYNHLDHSLYGRKRKKYENKGNPPANPMEMPGMCKHLMALAKALKDANLLD